MRTDQWENYISLNPAGELHAQTLASAREFIDQDDGSVSWDRNKLPLELAIARDVSPLPSEVDRELYYGQNHFNYWASGIRDYFQCQDWLDENDVPVKAILDLGCASGRFVRHMHYQAGVPTVLGCDINRKHVDWACSHLPREITIFQNTSIPSLPLPDDSLDLVTAFSVFTHIETFDTTWLMEIRRILRPGGIAWLTVHSDRTWREMDSTWPIHNALVGHADYKTHAKSPVIPDERFVVRWLAERSYSANVFYRQEYLMRVWGRILNWRGIFPALPKYQDVVVLQK